MIIKKFKNGRPVNPTSPFPQSTPIKKNKTNTASPTLTPSKKGCGCGRKK